MTLPPGALDPDLTATLTALVTVHERDGTATVRTVARCTGRRDHQTHADLQRLIDLDLAITTDVIGEVAPRCTVVAHTPRSKQ